MGLGSAAITRGADAARSVVPDDTDTRVPNRRQQRGSLVGRCLVDDDHFEIDVSLAQHAAERQCKKVAPVPCGNDDGYVHSCDSEAEPWQSFSNVYRSTRGAHGSICRARNSQQLHHRSGRHGGED